MMIREELARMGTWGERHRRLLARLLIAVTLSVIVDLAGAVVVWLVERGAKGTDVHTYGDALFFSTVQVLTVSSSLKNPLTTAGRVIDVFLELWAVFVITAVAGSFASFFQAGDASG
jgi:ion channel